MCFENPIDGWMQLLSCKLDIKTCFEFLSREDKQSLMDCVGGIILWSPPPPVQLLHGILKIWFVTAGNSCITMGEFYMYSVSSIELDLDIFCWSTVY